MLADQFVTCAEEIELLHANDSALCSDMCRPKCRYGISHIQFEEWVSVYDWLSESVSVCV